MNFYNVYNNTTRGHSEQTGTTQTRYFPSEPSVFETSVDDDNDDDLIYGQEAEVLQDNIYQGWGDEENNQNMRGFQSAYDPEYG